MTTSDPLTPSTTDDSSPRQPALTALLRRLHFYAGVFVGPFLLIAAVSGGLYAIAPSIEHLLYRDHLHVHPSGESRSVGEQITAAQAVRPDLTVTAVRPAGEPGDTTRVLFDDPSLGESERRAVFVDPATAQPVGDLVVYGSSGALPVRTWIDQLHRNLHLGEPGRMYSELAASWLWVIALAGAGLWFARRRAPGARLFTVDRTARGRARTLNWHGAVGLWIAAGLLFLSATGLTWSRYAGDHITELRAALSWNTPAVSTTLDGSAAMAGHDHHGVDTGSGGGGAPRVDEVDRVLQSARSAGVGGAVEVSIPSDSETAFTVAQTREPWVMSNNAVAVDGSTGRVTDTSWFADWPLAAKLAAWGIQLHMGLLFGLINQLALAVLAVALVTVIVRGYLMWWRRRPTSGGRPPARGVLRGAPPVAVAALVAVAAAIGWFIPLLGLSLLGFVVVDTAVGVAQRRNVSGGAR
ncbi:PepSY-associated TM helix domain-containing protein [Mycolicibacterium litorale]|uniref:Peptidase n=1 Tax=Mycolicibacterium litorale TaxID=758802 RepID=A0AAD1IKC7_9MYCO|nr:PepSY domain-containing protein [Mycolicibacterium litorale]MCV7415831.1 PepSY domain-containing protein [Mycolicibacterium litorale]TDY09082.1 putative iron-regulated membrane protein [Mycolicibacterium litorale]BBY17019.1 peptidase [Mycolicibacterium litorale]